MVCERYRGDKRESEGGGGLDVLRCDESVTGVTRGARIGWRGLERAKRRRIDRRSFARRWVKVEIEGLRLERRFEV
jgi:hypothetical protein